MMPPVPLIASWIGLAHISLAAITFFPETCVWMFYCGIFRISHCVFQESVVSKFICFFRHFAERWRSQHSLETKAESSEDPDGRWAPAGGVLQALWWARQQAAPPHACSLGIRPGWVALHRRLQLDTQNLARQHREDGGQLEVSAGQALAGLETLNSLFCASVLGLLTK